MTVPESNKPTTAVAIVSTGTSTKVHSFVRQSPVTSTSFQATQEETLRGDHNGRISVQPTSFEGGLLVGLYDPHLGPQCAEYLQQHLVPILDESLSTQLDHSDDDHHSHEVSPHTCRIDPNQVIDTLKSTFLELDELLLATAITVALAQPEDTNDLASLEEVKKTQEVIAQVVTGSTAMVGFLAPHRASASTGSDSQKHDLYLAQLGDSVAILAGLDSDGQWTARRLNPPEAQEHSVRYPGSEEYNKVVYEATERALTVEQYLTQHNGASSLPNSTGSAQSTIQSDSFLTRRGKFLGLPVTRAFGDLDWKIEQEPRRSVSNWVESSLRSRIDKTLAGGSRSRAANGGISPDEIGINNLDDPPYVRADPKISRIVLETRRQDSAAAGSSSDQLLILLNRGLLYTTRYNVPSTTKVSTNPYDQALISDFELSRVVANTLEKGEENCALAVAKALDQIRKEAGPLDRSVEDQQLEGDEEEGLEGSVLVVVL
ncbi:hypothetical protein K457DRAFT_134999 [Linnemannia elongata AG-77]|uniref:PPM-type phosphatase domain-containing protein n=1 Tax=Linnemannia elongata AG-77 TaxID=1314771 RepID=A0A197K911_9FUNG|nr:hypothetical protein K457DRAFT_134999 [Linnemannia elongata AG-77]